MVYHCSSSGLRPLVQFGLQALALAAPLAAAPVAAQPLERLLETWPKLTETAAVSGQRLALSSANPFTLQALANGVNGRTGPEALGPVAQTGEGLLFLPADASEAAAVPAVILLHGARGVSSAREMTYARQFATMGIAALVIDSFRPRRELASSFTERLIEITEGMILADVFAAQKALAARPEIDAERIALIGFSYGGMVSLYAAHRQVATAYRRYFEMVHLPPLRAHVAFYAPCIARFEDTRASGAPVLMMWGDQDELIDAERCRATAADLRAGGAEVETIEFPGAYHQWDGNLETPWRAPRSLVGCAFTVEPDGTIKGKLPGTPFHQTMEDSLSRKLILALCSDGDGYLVGKNAAVRVQSNRALGRFLVEAFRSEEFSNRDDIR